MKAEDILKRRRDRAIAIILSVKEREVDPILQNRQASHALRKVILDQLNDFYALAVDVAASSDADTYEFNPEVWLPRIEGRLHDILVAVSNGNGTG
jgi:hypothetical protein